MDKRTNAYAISVVIPVHNRGNSIARAIRSAFGQTFEPVEVIVVDDASTDDTASVVRDMAKRHANLKLLINEENMGGSAARNAGLKETRGDWVAFLDSDDEWYENKLEAQIDSLVNNPACVLVSCDWAQVSESDGRVDRVITRNRASNLQLVLGLRWVPPSSCALVDRQTLQDIGGFDETLASAQDAEAWVRLAEQGSFEHCTRVLLKKYADLDGNAIGGNASSVISGHERMLYKHQNRFRALPRSLRQNFYERMGRKLASTGAFGSARTYFVKAWLVRPWSFRGAGIVSLSLGGSRIYRIVVSGWYPMISGSRKKVTEYINSG